MCKLDWQVMWEVCRTVPGLDALTWIHMLLPSLTCIDWEPEQVTESLKLSFFL